MESLKEYSCRSQLQNSPMVSASVGSCTHRAFLGRCALESLDSGRRASGDPSTAAEIVQLSRNSWTTRSWIPYRSGASLQARHLKTGAPATGEGPLSLQSRSQPWKPSSLSALPKDHQNRDEAVHSKAPGNQSAPTNSTKPQQRLQAARPQGGRQRIISRSNGRCHWCQAGGCPERHLLVFQFEDYTGDLVLNLALGVFLDI